MGWAIRHWNILETRALRDHILMTNGPYSLLDLYPMHFFAWLEGVVREDEEGARIISDLYEDATMSPEDKRRKRIESIMEAQAAFGGA